MTIQRFNLLIRKLSSDPLSVYVVASTCRGVGGVGNDYISDTFTNQYTRENYNAAYCSLFVH